MTVAPQLSVGTTLQNIDDAWFSVFQSQLNPASPTLICGNFFLGLQGYVAVIVPLGEQLGLARGATIENTLLSASVTFRAAGNWSAGGQIEVNCMVDDSPRSGPIDARLAWKDPTGFGPNIWRGDGWGVFDQRIENTGGTAFLDSGPGAVNVAVSPILGLRERLAARFVIPAGPSWSVARVRLEMIRFGNPTGSMEVAIQGNGTNPGGTQFQPDGVDLGVSAAVLNSIIGATPTVIPYAFAPDVVLPPGTYWTVLRPAVAYTPNFADFIAWRQKRQFFGVGGAHFHTVKGVSLRLNTGNYPGHVDLHFDTLAKEVAAPILWNPPAASTGQTVQTPDLTSLVQEVILNSGHETASALMFTFRTVGETRTYRFAGNAHATLAPPGFACQFRRRHISAGPF